MCLLAWCIRYEPPLKTGPLFLWLVAALAIASAGNPLGWAKGMVVDWLPLYLILATYRVVWGLVDDLGIEPHLNPQHAFDTCSSARAVLRIAYFSGSGEVSLRSTTTSSGSST